MASCMPEKQLQQNNNETMDTTDDDMKDTEPEDELEKPQLQQQQEDNFNFPVKKGLQICKLMFEF